jgi:hypothetical protein
MYVIVQLLNVMARPRKVNDNAEILSYALLHLEKERDAIMAKIAHIRSQLGGRKPTVVAAESSVDAAEFPAKVRKPRVLSPAARKRISMAQKKRWAAVRKSTE